MNTLGFAQPIMFIKHQNFDTFTFDLQYPGFLEKYSTPLFQQFYKLQYSWPVQFSDPGYSLQEDVGVLTYTRTTLYRLITNPYYMMLHSTELQVILFSFKILTQPLSMRRQVPAPKYVYTVYCLLNILYMCYSVTESFLSLDVTVSECRSRHRLDHIRRISYFHTLCSILFEHKV